MKIAELIAALQKLPPEAEICIDAAPKKESERFPLEMKDIYEQSPNLYFILAN